MFQFLLIFRKAKAGELDNCSGLLDLYSQLNEIDVDEVGVGGASKFFQAKVFIFSARRSLAGSEHSDYMPLSTVSQFG